MAIIDSTTVVPGQLELSAASSSAQRWCLAPGARRIWPRPLARAGSAAA
jgi:hypothetical protein